MIALDYQGNLATGCTTSGWAYKMEGRVDLREFSIPGQPPEISIGDTVEVYLEKVEGSRGEALLSREKARREEAWDRLEKASGKNEKVDRE